MRYVVTGTPAAMTIENALLVGKARTLDEIRRIVKEHGATTGTITISLGRETTITVDCTLYKTLFED